MITNYVSKREISFKKGGVQAASLSAPQLPRNITIRTALARVSMPCAVGVVFTDSLVAFHAIEQQSRGHEFHHHHLGERAVVHLSYGNESTRSHNRYHQSFQYSPHNPVFFYWLSIAAVGGIAPPTSEAIQRSVFYISELHGIRT